MRPWFATIGYRGEIGAKETLKKSYLSLRWRLLMAQIMQCLGGKTGGLDQISNKDATILYYLANGVQVDYAKIIWEDLIHKLNKKTREKIVPYPRFLSLLLEHMMPEYENEELTINPTQVFSVHNLTLKLNQTEEPRFINHIKAIRNLNVPVDSKALKPSSQAKEGIDEGTKTYSFDHIFAGSNLSVLVDKTKAAGDGLKTTHTDSGANEESRADDISLKEKLEDYSDILKDTSSAFFNPDSLPDEPIIISDESKEEEEATKDKDTKATSYDVCKDTSVPPPPSPKSAQIQELMAHVHLLQSQKEELEQAKAKSKVEFASMKAKPSYPDITQLTKLLIKELKKHVRDMEIELPGDLKEIPTKLETFTSTISSLSSQVAELKNIQWELPAEFLNLPSQVSSVQEKLKTLDSLPSLLHKVTDTLNRFATMVENASGATSMNVPSAGKATASPAEGEKNTKDAEANLQKQLINLLGIEVVEQYHSKKLLFDKYCDKMLKRKNNPKITNCEVLTKKALRYIMIYIRHNGENVCSGTETKEGVLKVYKAGKRLLYIKRNKAISLGNVTSKVGIEVHQLSLKGLYLILRDQQEQVKIIEQIFKVDLSGRKKFIDSQMDDMIQMKNTKFAAFETEIDTLKQALSKHVKEKESLLTTLNGLKWNSKKENLNLLTKRLDFSLAEESRLKMVEKQNDLIMKKEKINITPINYSELNKLAKYCGKHFIPQQELSAEQKFWLQRSDKNSEEPSTSNTPVKIKVPSELPKVSLVNKSHKKLRFHLASFDKVVKVRTTPDAITEGSWGFEHTKKVFLTEIIPWLNLLKDFFKELDKGLHDEITEVQTVFTRMEADVEQCSVDRKCYEIQQKQFLIENDRLLDKIISQEIVNIVLNSFAIICDSGKKNEDSVDTFAIQLNKEFLQKDKSSDNQNNPEIQEYFKQNDLKAQLQAKDTVISKLKETIHSLRENVNPAKVKQDIDEIETINIELEHSVAKLLVISSTGASESKPTGNTKNNRISQSSSSNKTNKVEDQSRSVKSMKNKKNRVAKTECNAYVMQSMLNVNSKPICDICNECLFDANHDKCGLDY
ncbi:hypothetical protein Tco_1061313 [Tanacetum coccineum]